MPYNTTFKVCNKHSDYFIAKSRYMFFRYAFIFHRTTQEAERNFLKPIDYYLLGSECCMEYAVDRSAPSSDHQSFDNKTLLVRWIPENVSEHDLYHLFVGCYITKYCPSHSTHRSATTTGTKNKNKILSGYE